MLIGKSNTICFFPEVQLGVIYFILLFSSRKRAEIENAVAYRIELAEVSVRLQEDENHLRFSNEREYFLCSFPLVFSSCQSFYFHQM